jgi:uncharacterized protein YndB with AHSA1/START domain
VIVKTIPISARAAFEAWLSPEALQHFMCPAAGSSVSQVEVDPRVGGSFLIMMVVGGQAMPHRGEYLAIERYRRLAFTWRSHHAGEGSHVTLTFEEHSPNETQLTLEHFGLADPEVCERHRGGWTHILGEVERYASHPSIN